MPVYKTKAEKTKDNKIWYFMVSYTDLLGNKKRYKSKKYTTKDEATKEEAKFRMSIGEHSSSSPTFDEIFNEYIDFKSKRCRETTIITTKGYYKYIHSLLGNKKIEKLTNKEYVSFQNELNKTSLSTNYKNKIHRLVLSLVDYCRLNYNVSSNVPNNIGKFIDPYNYKEEMQFFTYDEFKQFINSVDDMLYSAFFKTLYYCGLRKGEILALNWNDIDFDNNTININKSLTTKIKGTKFQITPPKTPASNRVLPMTNEVLNSLKKLYNIYYKLDGFNSECFVFGCFNPIPNTTLERKKNYYCKQAGVKQIRIHDFRHSCASLLINNDSNPMLVAKYLGHTDVSMTLNRYSHLYKSKLVELIDLINNLN